MGDIVCLDAMDVCWDVPFIEKSLRQMFENSRQMQPGKSEVRVDVLAQCLNHNGIEVIELEVSDQGPGVRSEHKELMFDPLWSLRPSASQKHGTGLGLYWVKRVVRAHGGNIQEMGECGSGARFVIQLPRVCAGSQTET